LDESGIDFIKKCIQIIERRGLHEQGLYRIVGMQSKVNSVVACHFGKIFFCFLNSKISNKYFSLIQIHIKHLHKNWQHLLMKRWN
jgi:hypothetical protein